MFGTRIASAVALFLIAQPSHAGTNLCPLLEQGPNIGFDEMKSAFDLTTGCSGKAQVSALFKIVQCGTDLIRIDDAAGGPVVIISSDSLRGSIDLSCVVRRQFISNNVLVSDQAVIKGGFTASMLRGVSSILVISRSDAHQKHLADVLRWFYSVTAASHSFGVTEVRIADVDITSSDSDTLIKALRDRGSRVLSEEPAGQMVGHFVLSPPVGLEGVSEVSVSSVNRHIQVVQYTIPDEADYKIFIDLLDEKYGKSSRSRSDNCSLREWFSGPVGILGSYCGAAGNTVIFLNRGSAVQYSALLDMYEREAGREDGVKKARSKIVDRDNF